MTIDHAKEMLQRAIGKPLMPHSPTMDNALNLAIEALNRLRRDRAKGDLHPNDSLPGETNE